MRAPGQWSILADRIPRNGHLGTEGKVLPSSAEGSGRGEKKTGLVQKGLIQGNSGCRTVLETVHLLPDGLQNRPTTAVTRLGTIPENMPAV